MKSETQVKILKILKRLKVYNLARDIFLNSQNSAMVDFYRQFIAVDSLCFDIGANIGKKTDIFLKLGARVIAVEPQEECVHYLTKKYKNNPRVTIVAKAIAEERGEKEFFVCEANALSTTSADWIAARTKGGYFNDFGWDKKILVKTITMTDLIQQFGQPGFCKIDVEGGELSVIKGLTRQVPVISIEITLESLNIIRQCCAHLRTLGTAQYNHCCFDTVKFTFPEWVAEERMLAELELLSPQRLTGDLYVRF